MRLRDIKNIVSENIGKLEFEAEEERNRYFDGYRISEYQSVISAVENLSKSKIFALLTFPIEQIQEIYNSTLETVFVSTDTFYRFSNAVTQLKLLCQTFIETLDNIIPEQNENSISIKLPNHNNLNDLYSFIRDLDRIIQQSLVNKFIDTDVKIQNFDNGSLWIEIILGSQLASVFFASMVWAAAVIRKKRIEGDILIENAKGLKIKNESLQDIKDANKKLLDDLVDAETDNLINQLPNGAKNDKEYVQRLRNSVKMLAELIDKGTEIHPALTAPEEVKNLLPDFKQLNSIQSKIKQLTEGGGQNTI